MSRSNTNRSSESGFTFVELLVVLAITALLFALSTINLGHTQSTASLDSVTNVLIADLRNQQILAMTGDEGSTTSQQPHGIYIQSSNYILFADANYIGTDPKNFTVNVSPVSISTTLPSNQVTFNTGDGSVADYVSGDNTITISESGDSKTITINRFGATTVN